MKRAFDIFFSAVFLIILAIPMLIIAALIKLTSKGPVIFRQKRIGRNGREFMILKFRTMHQNAPKNTPTHLLKNPDAYITRVGRALRLLSLDELPQLYNILKGDMSFVGPRPALFNQKDLIALREQRGVNALRPGLTGWAQINGRDELPIPVKVEYDAYYLNNMSFWLDMKILCLTVARVFSHKGVVEGSHSSGFRK